jgi:hypothetical protein
LPQADAKSLANRLLKNRSSDDLFDYSTAGLRFDLYRECNHTPLLLYFSRGKEDAVQHAQTVIDRGQKKAETSRDQARRAHWAQYVICCAVAFGDLELYKAALLWARRFNKDPLTVREVYAETVIASEESLDILCGIPERPHDSTSSLADIAQAVKLGNELCLLLLETTRSGLREPSFNANDWETVLGLFQRVVQVRLDRVNRVQEKLHVSDDDFLRPCGPIV